MLKGLLPVGSVVLLEESQKKVIIIGVGQVGGTDGKLWDYAGVPFPEGYLDGDNLFLFNREQIFQVFFLGYQDREQQEFKQLAEETIAQLRQQML